MRNTIRKATSSENTKKVSMTIKLVAAGAVLALAGGLVYVALTNSMFSVSQYEFKGNKYLSESDLMKLMGVTGGENIFKLSSAELAGCLQGSPWVRGVRVRKEFPHKMIFQIEESAPQAILEDNQGGAYLVDEMGRALQKLQGQPAEFLPVIAGDKDVDPKAYLAAVELAMTLKAEGIGKDGARAEIRGMELGGHELELAVDGLRIKIGEDRLKEKIATLLELIGQIRKLDIAVEYIDLRFDGRVVVKHITAADASGPAVEVKEGDANSHNTAGTRVRSSKDSRKPAAGSRL